MFRLFRTALLLLVAFVAGVLYERGAAQDRCRDGGGDWAASEICIGPGRSNE